MREYLGYWLLPKYSFDCIDRTFIHFEIRDMLDGHFTCDLPNVKMFRNCYKLSSVLEHIPIAITILQLIGQCKLVYVIILNDCDRTANDLKCVQLRSVSIR